MDTISDMIIRLKNSGNVGKAFVSMPYSKMKYGISLLLSKEGFVGEVSKKSRKGKKIIEVGLLYNKNGSSKIKGVKRISKPSRRVYVGVSGVKPVKHGFGRVILSTPSGIITGEEAKKCKSGGEVLFEIW